MPLQEEMIAQGNMLFKNRSFLPLVVLSLGIIVFIFHHVNGFRFDDPMVYFGLCFFVGILGLAIRIFTVGHTPDGTSGRNTKQGQVAEVLNTSGIYATVRHPLYLGNFLMWLAPALLTADVWFIVAFILAYWLYYERIMLAEEDYLKKKFGTEYLIWAEKTPAFLPAVNQFQPNNQTFIWSKVVLKEKNGLAALIILFCGFDMIRLYFTTENIGYTSSIWFIPSVAVLLLYLVLKIVKHKR